MNKLKLFSIVLLSLLILSGCDEDVNETNCIEVRQLVNFCGHAVFQVVNNNYPGRVGTWESPDGTVYENTFSSYINPCELQIPGGEDPTFFVSVVSEPVPSDCLICQPSAPDHFPDEFYYVKQTNSCANQVIQ